VRFLLRLFEFNIFGFYYVDQNVKRESGRKVQVENISAGKVSKIKILIVGVGFDLFSFHFRSLIHKNYFIEHCRRRSNMSGTKGYVENVDGPHGWHRTHE